MKFKYWLTSLTDISNAKKKLLHDFFIIFEMFFLCQRMSFLIFCFSQMMTEK